MTILEFYYSMAFGLEETQIKDLGWLFKYTLPVDINEWGQCDITNEQVADLAQKVDRLFHKEPLAYILGYTDFYWCKINVTPSVLIPRPETEELCDLIVQQTKLDSARVLDLCTGSGCISVALAKAKPNWQIIGADISPDAIKIAEKNAQENGVNAKFILSDMWQNIEGKFDCIVSNPPYINTKEILSLPQSVRDFEPHLALDGGEDGLDYYRNIAENASQYLQDAGYLYLEIGETQAEAIVDLLKNDFTNIQIKKDLFGKERYVLARKK